MHKEKNSQGFTLIELSGALVIVGILSLIAMALIH